ncbi:U-scoloptoxin(05)-Cw1a [Hyalella azteca]|uniref:U-scoloptoxin(05)-Cw1a n=1 Tax=Hyalella azteca TaxID=294128 RepID=A0A8B7NTE6_HYAAZ|nr:U-scoloptoxin(05)-Cw1a [Hyalella azteca]
MANVKLLPSYLIMVFYLVHRVSALSCYECSSKEDVTTCGETLAPSHNLEPVNCSHIRNPQYCIKKTGLFEGVLGTSRFCSSKDFGNYCELVTRPGDERQYYACVYTCSGNACNPASIKKLSVLLLLMSVLLVASH